MSGPDLTALMVVVKTADSFAYDVEYRADGKGTTTRAFGRINFSCLLIIYAESIGLSWLEGEAIGAIRLAGCDAKGTLLKIAE